jgi:hypothetical protein
MQGTLKDRTHSGGMKPAPKSTVYGIRKNRSTTDVLTILENNIVEDLRKRQSTADRRRGGQKSTGQRNSTQRKVKSPLSKI